MGAAYSGVFSWSLVAELGQILSLVLMIAKHGADTITKKRKRNPNTKPRGVNQCKKVANLKKGQKLQVDIYNKRPVGKHQGDITRHMGKLVRDRTICPVRVHDWKDMDERNLEHNKFAGKDMELDRHTTFEHMRRLWQNWRGILSQGIKDVGGLENALKETPNDLTPEDWKWLVKEHFSSDKFLKVSARNSDNRGSKTMPHRTGSKPFRQVIYQDLVFSHLGVMRNLKLSKQLG